MYSFIRHLNDLTDTSLSQKIHGNCQCLIASSIRLKLVISAATLAFKLPFLPSVLRLVLSVLVIVGGAIFETPRVCTQSRHVFLRKVEIVLCAQSAATDLQM